MPKVWNIGNWRYKASGKKKTNNWGSHIINWKWDIQESLNTLPRKLLIIQKVCILVIFINNILVFIHV